MILFSWTLTPNQIMALRSVADYHQAYEYAAARRDRKLLEGTRLNCLDIPHWSTAVRGLLREGFVRHSEVPMEKWEKGVNGHGTVRQLWEVTEKGRLMLQIVAIEVEEQAKTLALDRKQLKLLQAA